MPSMAVPIRVECLMVSLAVELLYRQLIDSW